MDNTHYSPEEPIAAVATSLAPAALGIVRVSGKNSVALLSKIFSRPKALASATGNTIVYGWIVHGNKKIDEVLISVFRAPKSFTGEEMAEISCHGGTAVVTKIFNLLLENGFRKAERGEFTFRAFINGKSDLTRAEAVREIIESRTNASSERAAGRLSGALFDEISAAKKFIVDTLAQIEVGIEYPEDEETIASSFDKENLLQAERILANLASTWKSEKLYQEGARIVLCGKTNAGKSSLFNALLKEERAIVSDTEGTTRDWIESWVSIDGIPARLFDTAGLRQTSDTVELRGLEATRDLSDGADLILYLADASAQVGGGSAASSEPLKIDQSQIDIEFLSSRKERVIFIWNKIDKIVGDMPAEPDTISAAPADGKFSVGSTISCNCNIVGECFVSAKTGSGIKELIQMAKSVLLQGAETERVQAGLGSERQKRLVEEALESVRHALLVCEDYSLDAVVQDLEDALDFLGELTGEVTASDILESVFANFCVGK